MIKINLLPQEEIPKQKSIKLPQMGAFVPVAVVLVVICGLAMTSTIQAKKISDMQAVITEEEAESRRLAPEIAKIKRLNQQRSELNQRLDVIADLDRDRYFRIHILDELNRARPEHMWLTRVEDVGGDRYAIEGVTFSNFLVSDFLQSVNQSPYFTAVNLRVAEKGTIMEQSVVSFKCQFTAVRHNSSGSFGS